MKKNPSTSTDAAELRRRAEARLSEKQRSQGSEVGGQRTADNTQRLVQELQIHQIELEMQNEELQKARVEAEAVLDQYTDLYDFAPAGYFTLNRDGAIRRVNLTGAGLLSVERAQLVNRRFGLFVSDDSRPAFNAFLKKVFESQAKETCEATLLKEGNEPLCAHLEATASEDGRECRIAAVDITARKRAEEAIRDSEARYRAVMEQSADGIYLIDVETKHILEANLAFAQMLGCTAEEIRGLSVYDFVAAKQEVIDQRFQERVNGKGPSSYERQYRKKDGSLVEVWVSLSPISYGGRKVMCALVRDLTEKKALEVHLLRAQRMESIGLLAGGIAHDLNNLLTPILINAELLSPALSEPTSQKMLSSIASNAQRGADIVKQILAFARGMEGEYLFISPRYLLKETERFVKETFPKTIAIHAEIPPDLWPLSGDATQLHQVLMNLCLNAKDAMEKGGTLSLSAENSSVDETYAKMHPEAKVGSYVVFSVEDTGCGILPSHLEKIFDPFFTTKERGQGTGLGLSTAHGIVKGHGGFLNVYSELGRGTKFHVYLPASPSAEMAKVEKERAPLPSGHGELILVVEDEASIREITQIALETLGYRVMAAADGAEAVSLYAQHPGEIQVVITDMAMPIMDGPTTIRALQKMDPAVKVIATSGMDAERMLAEASRAAVKAFLQKPFTADRLLRTVAEVLKGGGRGPGVGDT
jgi:PAS domain S-box-containing protein